MSAIRTATLALLLTTLSASAHATDVFGSISANTTWTAAGSPYRITSDLVVAANITLTIEAGVEVRGLANAGLTVNGNLLVNGTAALPVTFRADAASPTNGIWDGIALNDNSTATINNLVVNHAATALKITAPESTSYTINGVDASNFSVRGLDLVGPGTTTVTGLVARSTTAAANPVYVSSTTPTTLTLRNGWITGGQYAVNATNTNLVLDHTIIASATVAGVYLQAANTSATSSLDIDYCTFWKNADAIRVYRPSSSYSFSVSLDRSIFTENTTIFVDQSDSFSKIPFSRFVENVWTGSRGSSTPTTDTGNLNYEALLSDPQNGDFSPTERSPARYLAPSDANATLGAASYTGKPSPAGIHGFWYSNKTFAADSVTDVSGDVVIAPGTTMTFLPGATLRMIKGDVMKGGKNSALVELRVEGTLEADGTNSKPVRFTSGQATLAPGDWYGIVIVAATQAFNVSQVDLGYAFRGVTLESNDHIVAGSDIHDCSDAGIWVSGGTPNIESTVLHHNIRGLYAERATALDMFDVDVHHNSQQGARFVSTKVVWRIGRIYDNAGVAVDVDIDSTSSTWSTELRNVTIANNGTTAITIYRPSSSYSYSLTLADSSVTHNVGVGIYDESDSFSRIPVNCSYSNIWGNQAKSANVSFQSDTCFVENPLYANIDVRDYAPTTYSPNRKSGAGGALVGAVDYDDVAGPYLEGFFWEDFTFTKAGSPWPILGDLTVPSGVTVRFEPGARLQVVPNDDGMKGGLNTSRAEIRVRDGGKVVFDGGGDPIIITPATASPTPGTWVGLRLDNAATSAIDNLRVEYAQIGLSIFGAGSPTVEDFTSIYHSSSGLRAESVSTNPGVDVLAASLIGTGSGTGIDLHGSNARVRSSYITHHTTGIATERSVPGSSAVKIVNNTIVHHTTGISVYRASSSYTHTINIENNVVAANTSAALVDQADSFSRHSMVMRNNNWFGVATLSQVTGGTSTNNVTSDPRIEDDDWDPKPRWWDGKLWAESLSINAGLATATDLPTRDIAGKARNLGGGVDIGAWEFDGAANREPRADAVTASKMVPRGESFVLDGAAATDFAPGFIASAFWTMSDGTVTAGQTINHTFATDGAHWAYITIVDNQGAEDHALVTLNVNIRPIADAGPAVFQDEGPAEDVFFDGTLSTDPDGTVVGWSWDFGDGTPVSTLKSPRHSYLSAGLYTVTLTVTDNEGLTHTDTTLATVYGALDNVGPLVQHTEIADGVPVNTAVQVTADVRDPSGVASVVLQYRAIGATSAKFALMTPPATGHIYTATIPAVDVTSAGVQYWFVASDDADPNSNTSTTPNGAPTTDTFDFLVVGDPNPPSITHTPITNGQPPGSAIAVTATITDATGVASANLYFRPKGGTSFGAAPMSKVTGNTWSAQIPAFIVASPGVDYYIQATDSSPIPNSGVAPAGAPTSVYTFTVGTGDTTPPIIAHTPISNGRPAGSAVAITASAADNTAVTAVTLYYRATGGGAFTSAPLTAGSGTSWNGSIPAGAVTVAGVDYYLIAADAAGNTAASPTDAPTTFHAFTVVPVDNTGPSITHTPVTNGQAEGVAVPVSATITDTSGVASVKLFYRPEGFPIFQEVAMTNSGSTYSASIPSFVVSPPKVEYYIRATDSANNVSNAPAAGATAPYGFTVVGQGSDTTAPSIVFDPIADGRPAGAAVAVNVAAFDASGVASVTLYYRKTGTSSYTTLALTEGSANSWSATIPAAAVVTPGVDYYLVAVDKSANANQATNGTSAAPNDFTVVVPDTTAPAITHTPVTAINAGDPLVITATITDAVGVTSATLEWALGSGQFTSTALVNSSGNTWAVTIPAASIPGGTTQIRYYLQASDAATNSAKAPPAGATSPYSVVVVPPDSTAPSVNLSLVPNGQAQNVAVTVSATITDTVGVSGATLHYRASNSSGSYTSVAMTNSGSNYSGVIPANAIVPPGISYYVRATDAATNAGYGPATAPTTPATFTVTASDTAGPTIVHVPVAGPLSAGAQLVVSATISDASTVASATLHYRTRGLTAFTTASMTNAAGVWSATIPSLSEPGVDYWIDAKDSLNNTSNSPSNAPTGVHTIDVVVPDTAGPTIAHDPISGSRPAGSAVAIEATVTDASGVAAVELFYRTGASGNYTQVALSGAAGNWSGIIPGSAVQAPGVQYYLRATDNATNASTSPASAPTAIHSFTVGGAADTTGPSITHTPITAAQTAGAAVAINATVSDATGVASVSVWFRVEGTTSWLSSPLTKGTGTAWSGAIPGLAVSAPGVEYYLEAVDSSGNANHATNPSNAPTSFHAFDVVVPDTSGPNIIHEPVTATVTAGTAVAITATVTDPSTVASVRLYYKNSAGGAFTDIAMSASGNLYSASIPGVSVNAPSMQYYIRAVDASPAANASTTPASAPTATHSFNVTAPADTTPPVITHTPLVATVDVGATVNVSASVTDASTVTSVTLWFRVSGTASWLSTPLTKGSGSTWAGAFPTIAIAAPGVDYYLEAVDAAGNHAVSPTGAPTSSNSFDVIVPDTFGPEIEGDAIAASIEAGTPLPLAATVTDDSGVAKVELVLRVNNGAWTRRAMTAGANDRWALVLPGTDVVEGTLDVYFAAEDALGNTSETPPAAVEVEPAAAEDETPPTILHSPVTVVEHGEPVAISAIVTDASDLDTVEVYFREGDTGSFLTVSLAETTPDHWEAEIPGIATRGETVEYYLVAVDDAPAANRATFPEDAPDSLITVDVLGGQAETAEPSPEPEPESPADTDPTQVEQDSDTSTTSGTDVAETTTSTKGKSEGGCNGGGAGGSLLALAAIALAARRRTTRA